MHHPTDRITHTTAFVTPVVENLLEREIAQWVISMKDRSDDPSRHERTLLPRSYITLPGTSASFRNIPAGLVNGQAVSVDLELISRLRQNASELAPTTGVRCNNLL